MFLQPFLLSQASPGASKPPFKAATALDTILQVITEEPVPPSRVNGLLPRDLETICLKCLQKKPRRRYASALALAEDLHRFQAGEPILARPVGRLEKLVRLSRRKPALVALAGLSLVVLGLLAVLINRPDPPANQIDPPGRQINPQPDRIGQLLASPEIPRAKTFTNTLGMEFMLVPRGKSWLGGGAGNPGTEVDIPYDFYLGKYEVTQEEWEKVTGINPSQFTGAPTVTKRLPVEQVSCDDCQVFIDRVNDKTKEAGWVYRLPTGVEWEYACRGGAMKEKFESAFDFYFEKPTNTLLPEQANFEHGKGLKRTCKVGSYQPNRLGLYDMHGNVWEWCQDEIPGDPKNPKEGSQRVNRGGCWHSVANHCPAANWYPLPASNRSNHLGLRLARVPVGAGNHVGTLRTPLLVPAFFYPEGQGLKDWNGLLESPHRNSLVVIVNPDSGPGDKADPNYQDLVNRSVKAKLTLIGYITTSYAKRPLADVKTDVDRWVRFYPGIQGIFFDEQAEKAEKVDYQAALYDYVRKVRKLGLVITCPGTVCAEEFFTRPACDSACLFEGKGERKEFQLPAWVAKHRRQVGALVYHVSKGEDMRWYLQEAKTKQFAWIYVSDRSGATPWEGLPSYWEEEISAIIKK